MKNALTLSILATLILAASLTYLSSDNKADSAEFSSAASNNPEANKEFTVDTKAILDDPEAWWRYYYYNIRLAQDFIGLDVDSTPLSKTDFLNRLTTGNFAPFKIRLRNNVPVYKLYELSTLDPNIPSTIQQMAAAEVAHYKMEGKELPAYAFTDLNGKTYDKTTTKGKIIVLKCWYIGCIACVEEFPDLNKLVDTYKGRSDIEFISLAKDSKDRLVPFLAKEPFSYAVVPDQKEYMVEQLAIGIYPTHLLLDKTGKIVKVTNSIDDMIPFIKKQAGKGSF